MDLLGTSLQSLLSLGEDGARAAQRRATSSQPANDAQDHEDDEAGLDGMRPFFQSTRSSHCKHLFGLVEAERRARPVFDRGEDAMDIDER